MNPCGEFEVALQELQELTTETLPSRRQAYRVTISIALELTPGEAESLDSRDVLRDYPEHIEWADIHVERADY